ncbi:MAG: hypothetical protein J6L96_04675 [Clostridia bacterium]|nr:hypothetical protein [Clostridia bacterium]
MSYKTELHCHTSEFSYCAGMSGVDKAKLYIENGYSTVVLTNHISAGYRSDIPEHRDVVRKYFEAAEVMRDAANGKLNVIVGMELCFKGDIDDYLIYGMDEEMLAGFPEIFDFSYKYFYQWADEHDVIMIQAHPLRCGIIPRDPWYIHGAELYNASHDPFYNRIAEAWADVYDNEFNHDGRRFIRTSGSDHHSDGQRACGGIVTDFEIKNNADLLSVLRSGEYELLREVN